MLQAHSLLWHYLWVAPNVYLLALGFLVWAGKTRRGSLAFVVFSFIIPLAQLILYAADVLPWIAPHTFWHVLWSGLLVEGLIKFILIGELFDGVFSPYPSLANLGKVLIRGVGAVLVFVAAIAAAL